MRRILTVAAILAILAAGTGSVRAADSLGATVGTLAGWPFVRLVDQSTLAETFTLDPPDGWQLASLSVSLEPGESRDVPVTKAGKDGQLAVHVAPTIPVAGEETSALVLVATLEAHAPLALPWAALAIIGLCLVLAIRPASRLVARRQR